MIDTLLEFLTNWTWRSALLVVAALLIIRTLPSRNANARHAIWIAALVSILLLPILVGLGRQIPREAKIVQLDSTAPAEASTIAKGATTGSITSGTVESESSASAIPVERIKSILLTIGLIGFGLIALRLLLSQRFLLKIARQNEWHEPEWISNLIREMGIQRRVEFVFFEKGSRLQPMTWGWLKPKIGLPNEAIGWDENQLRAVVGHELAHIKRNDFLAEWLCQMLLAFQWWNPLVWLAVCSLRLEREKACDDMVMNLGQDRRAFAQILLDVSASKTVVARPAMAEARRLEERIQRILDFKKPVVTDSARFAKIGLLIPIIMALPMAWLGWADEKPVKIDIKKLAFDTVVIDAGHGAHDSGGSIDDVKESELTLSLANVLKDELEEMGVKKVILTRKGDDFISLLDRVALIETVEKAVVISLHFNMHRDQNVEGIEIYRGGDPKSARLSGSVEKSLKPLGEKFRGNKEANFTILRDVKHPTIIVEGGFLSHKASREKILTAPYQLAMAKALAEGILSYDGKAAEAEPDQANPSGDWYKASLLSEKAQKLVEKGKTATAINNLNQSEELLRSLKKDHPEFQPEVVAHRLKVVQKQLADLKATANE